MFRKVFIYIDESGTLPDPKDPAVVIAAVATYSPDKLLISNKSVIKTLRRNNTSEVKFYTAGRNTKNRFLTILAKQDIRIFTLILEKHGKKISDTPENFALICSLLLRLCLQYYRICSVSIIFDRHFHNLKDRNNFDTVLKNLCYRDLDIFHVDSLKEPAVNTADMVAGSVLWKLTGKDTQFYNIIKDKINIEKTIDWKDTKKRFINKKLVRTDASIHPKTSD